MDIVKWAETKFPGIKTVYVDKIEIAHVNELHSTFWLRNALILPPEVKNLGDIYDEFDGIDLFSSTFKIASVSEARYKGSVKMTFTLKELQDELARILPKFPERAIPFMYQAGIGYYAIGLDTGKIFEWDSEQDLLSDSYANLEGLFNEWSSAVYGV